jgi:hypothetical protein
VLSVYTFGDSILDCGHYNAFGINPGQLLVHNEVWQAYFCIKPNPYGILPVEFFGSTIVT